MPVVFLCVGAAKAGTSWLHRQLSAHPECHFRTIKELHYFNALENGKLDHELAKHQKHQKALLDKIVASGRGAGQKQQVQLVDRAAWMNTLENGDNPVAYLDYLKDGAGDACVVGDMTPAYALLPETRLKAMAKAAPDVRVLYLMRDPVERLWSHVRMIAARRDKDGQVTEKRCAHLLNRTLSGEEAQIVKRSDYAGALTRLGAAIAPSRLLIEVFEEMVQGEGLGRICDFLGIARVAPDTSRVHTGQALEMTDAQRRMALDWLRPQYDAAFDTLGRMPEGWAMEGAR